jgi:hypothetical protein
VKQDNALDSGRRCSALTLESDCDR